MIKRLFLSGIFVCATLLEGQRLPQTTTLQVQAKVEALLRQMTLKEKIGQLNLISGAGKSDELIASGEAGAVLWVSDPKEIDRLQRLAVEKSRLHIPLLVGLDVVQGYRTIFPAPLAMASTWDPELVEQEQRIAAQEARSAGINWTFAPMVDIAHDARWGRIVEGAGEDPYLGAAMAQAQVYGFQGHAPGGPESLLATVKHFAGYGAAEGGRDYDGSYLPEEQLWNVYFPPFKAAIDAGVSSVMSAYMDLNDVPASGNKFLLHDVLRNTWGFNGFVVSDAFAVGSLVKHGYAKDRLDAAWKAFSAGLNMDMASGVYSQNLIELVNQGKITETQIDDAVRPILTAKFRLSLFEHPYADMSKVDSVLSAPEHKQFARTAAQRAIVLLRNENGLLPLALKGKYKSIAVIGPLADAHQELKGTWGAMIAHNENESTVSVLDGIRSKAGSDMRVEYAKGTDIQRNFPSTFDHNSAIHEDLVQTAADSQQAFDKAIDTAKHCDIAVLVLGESFFGNGEAASRASLALQGKQEELLESVVALGKPVVLVLINGRPLDISWAAEHVGAIVEAWIPGEQGGAAVADVLFGDVNPGGKLPVGWPRGVGQEPLYYSHNLTQEPENQPGFKSRYYDKLSSPLFPFGHGLSYTTFSFSSLKMSNEQPKRGETINVSVDVQNTGSRAGDVVVQLYIHQRSGSASRPVRQLKGFTRLNLKPNEKRTATFTLTKNSLSFWSPQIKQWVEEPATFDVWVGEDSIATLHGLFKVIETMAINPVVGHSTLP